MKRLLLILFIILLTACAGRTQPVGTPAPASPAPTAVPTEEPPSVVEVAEPTATPAPTAAPTEAPTEAPTATQEPTPEPPFSMVWVSDTQTMVAYPSMYEGFTAMCDWIVENAEARNFKLYLHSGDMVDNGLNREQWSRFCEGVRPIAEKMPLFVTAGNHDRAAKGPSYWTEQFFVTEFPPEQSFNDCSASYMILNEGSTSILFLSICYVREVYDAELDWLKAVCDAHPDLPAVLLVHGYLTKDGGIVTMAQYMEEVLVSQCPNIKLILCGHARGIARQTFVYDDDGDEVPDRTVNVLMYDVQEDRKKYGYLCLLTYDPATNSLFVDSYSPFLDDYIYNDDDVDTERFTIKNVF